MGFESITDEKIGALLGMPKRVTNPSVKGRTKGKHLQQDYNVVAINDSLTFKLYLRQNNLIAEDFSCGLSWSMVSGEILTLIRYNGSSHTHLNAMEQEKLESSCHIHKATAKYILNNLKPAGFASFTNRYSDLKGALQCMIMDCNIAGLITVPNNMDMFACQ